MIVILCAKDYIQVDLYSIKLKVGIFFSYHTEINIACTIAKQPHPQHTHTCTPSATQQPKALCSFSQPFGLKALSL